MRAILWKSVVLAALIVAPGALGEVVEEETWYNAEGVVVKKVKRTLTGADAQRSGDWEPAWVTREKQSGARTVRYSSSRWGRSGYWPSWGSSYYVPTNYCYGSRRRATGFTGYYRGGSRWGASYRSPGLSIRYRH